MIINQALQLGFGFIPGNALSRTFHESLATLNQDISVPIW